LSITAENAEEKEKKIRVIKGDRLNYVTRLYKSPHSYTECHLPYGITQCHLPSVTSEHTPP